MRTSVVVGGVYVEGVAPGDPSATAGRRPVVAPSGLFPPGITPLGGDSATVVAYGVNGIRNAFLLRVVKVTGRGRTLVSGRPVPTGPPVPATVLARVSVVRVGCGTAVSSEERFVHVPGFYPFDLRDDPP